MNSPFFLVFFVWILPHLMLAGLGVVFYRLRLHREFPCFFAYICYEVVEFVFLYTLHSLSRVTDLQYHYAYFATLAVSVALRFGVVDEIFRDLLREASSVAGGARFAMRLVQALLLAAGILLTIYAPGAGTSSGLLAGLNILNRGLAMVQSGFLLFLFLLCAFFGLSWRRPVFGIALGLGIIASVDLVIFALRSEPHAWALFMDLMRTTAYLICVSLWIGYAIVPERKSDRSMAVSEEDLKLWNREFQRLLRR